MSNESDDELQTEEEWLEGLKNLKKALEGGYTPGAFGPGSPLVITDDDRASAENLAKAMRGEPQDQFTVVVYRDEGIKLVKNVPKK